jgi:hypothetical protein
MTKKKVIPERPTIASIKARLAESDEDIKHGRVYGPFDTHKEFMAALRREGAKPRAKRKD